MKVERAKKEVIQDCLLTALDDKSKVAILLNSRELRKLINCLILVHGKNCVLAKDFNRLYKAAFGE